MTSTGYRCPLYDSDALPTDDPSQADQPEDHPCHRVHAAQQEQIGVWKTRVAIGRPPAQTARPAPALGAPRPMRNEQVARRFWIRRNCPRCQALAGKNCVVNAHTGTGAASKTPTTSGSSPSSRNAGPRRNADGGHRGRTTSPARTGEGRRANAAPHPVAAGIARVPSAREGRSAAPGHPVRASEAPRPRSPSHLDRGSRTRNPPLPAPTPEATPQCLRLHPGDGRRPPGRRPGHRR
ncbi:hypothetical protein QFZ49_007589 [Streptomyces turgidiscabies]|uniref:Uncharacterized protein n=1 Tax=Streptomyces turgidiscabies TaxID=85558 RepID=A0ABU0S033_9ACTN|nr:hypothetical protein [Streptomyces turgidiscabies]